MKAQYFASWPPSEKAGWVVEYIEGVSYKVFYQRPTHARDFILLHGTDDALWELCEKFIAELRAMGSAGPAVPICRGKFRKFVGDRL